MGIDLKDDRSALDAMFNPRSVALFGASESASSVGAKVFSNLLAAEFEGEIVPINPKYQKVAGRTCYPTLADVGHPVDLAVVATPARTVPGIIRQCAAAGTRNAIVLSAGFGEGGEADGGLADDLLAAAHNGGVRIMGPNCVGLVRPHIGLDATFLRSTTPPGRLALVSQSGALCSAIADWAEPHDLGFSALVSLGNSLDVGFGDVVEFLETDPRTSAILLYVEGLRDAASFLSAMRRVTQSKPVLVLKAGRHSQSSQAAHTHTGALIGNDDVFDAALRRVGGVRVPGFGQLFAAAEILSAAKECRGNRLCIVTNGGGAGVLAADRAGDLGIDLPPPSETTLATLDKVLPPFWSRGNPVDILGDASPDDYAAAVAASLADPDFDGVLVMLTPQAMTEATDAARKIVNAIPQTSRKPLLACWMGETAVAEGRRHLSSAGVPDFTTPERAVEAFSYLAAYDRNRKLSLETPGPMEDVAVSDVDGARMIVEAALAEGREMLSDIEAKAVLRAFGISVNTTLVAESAEAALVAAETVGFPVAMKILSPQISHKSDVGGVRVGISTAADVKSTFRSLVDSVSSARPDADIRGVTVEKMANARFARELVVGVNRDPVFGPVILFGAGGTAVEVLRDSALELPPLNEVLARRLIGRTKVSRLLEAFRDQPAADLEGIVGVLMRVSDLVCELPAVTGLDINPLFAAPDGVIVVDARIMIARPPAAKGPYDHVPIHPYPRHLVRRQHLRDGTPLIIRPIRAEDAEGEAAFVRGLSDETKRFRFMGALDELSPQMLARFTQIDYRREMALVAILERGGETMQVGVARYQINPGHTSCEFAIVVSDETRQQGIGTRLMKALIEAARDQGLTRMQGYILKENEAMLQLMEELGFTQERIVDDPGTVFVRRAL